jgi:cytochrome bd-type quinol oxidase subunit 2
MGNRTVSLDVADQLTVQAAAGASTTLEALLVVVAFAAVSVLPSLAYLLWFTQKSKSALVDGHSVES